MEPLGRNTAPALTIAAQAAMKDGADPVLLVMPADHVIVDKAAFQAVVRKGRGACGAGRGGHIHHRIHQMGYGLHPVGRPRMVQMGLNNIARFVEEAIYGAAPAYLAEGNYLSGTVDICMMRASVWLAALKVCRADILAACDTAWAQGIRRMVSLCAWAEHLASAQATQLTMQ